jgi:hypothetical protein
MPRKKQSWRPATSFKVTKLKPNGPKAGQSTDAWMYGKQKEERDFQERIQHDSKRPPN